MTLKAETVRPAFAAKSSICLLTDGKAGATAALGSEAGGAVLGPPLGAAAEGIAAVPAITTGACGILDAVLKAESLKASHSFPIIPV